MKKCLFLCMAVVLALASCDSNDNETFDNTYSSEMVAAQFQQYFFEEDGTPKIVQLEEGTTWYANVANGKRVIELFNIITGLNVKEEDSYYYKFQSSDKMAKIELKGTVEWNDEAIFGVMDVVIPGHPEIRKIIFVHKDFFNGTNADTFFPIVM